MTAEDEQPGVAGLRSARRRSPRDAGDLDVHLQRGDAVGGAGDLEVHVAEVILGALDVGQHDVVVALLDQAHRDARDRRLDRHAGVHQRERRAADRGHRGGAVRLEDLGDDAHRVRELSASGMTGTSARSASAPWPMSRRFGPRMKPGLADRERREVVVVDVALRRVERQVVDALLLLGRAKRGERQRLGLAAGEEGRAVRARRDRDVARDGADLLGAAVGAALVDRDLLADDLLVDRVARPCPRARDARRARPRAPRGTAG